MLELIIKMLSQFIDFVVYGKAEGECPVIHLTADNVTARKLILAIARVGIPVKWSLSYNGTRGVCRKESNGDFVTWTYSFNITKRWTLAFWDAAEQLIAIFEIVIK